MDNAAIADVLKLTSRLMELHGANSFKVKSYQNASFKIDRLTDPLDGLSPEELEKIDGIGKSLSKHIYDLNTLGTFSELQELLKKTPEGVLEMMKIKGIGPKKLAVIWHELGIETPGELLYACNENRLVELKGFGEKTQREVKKAIEYRLATRHLFHYAQVDVQVEVFMEALEPHLGSMLWSRTGALRRCCEVLEQADLLFAVTDATRRQLEASLQSTGMLTDEWQVLDSATVHTKFLSGIPLVLHFCETNQFAYRNWELTGSSDHVSGILKKSGKELSAFLHSANEEEIYAAAGMTFVVPELREAESPEQPTEPLITVADIRGILHTHSTWSDGEHSLEQMAVACRDLGYEYLGISDHSKSAFYANGLSAERVLEQQAEVKALNAKLAPFRIFHGIESDILADGNLDYPEDILKQFDFFVASVHSVLKMDEEKATLRLLTAIENPYTTILGHPTGRLLLARQGYPINYKKIIDACAANGVVIELNAHPYRLDLDWRWIAYAVSKNVMISINPDAHAISGYGDVKYGVLAARKGGLTAKHTFNCLSLQEIESRFTTKC